MNQSRNLRQFGEETAAAAEQAREEGREKKYQHLMNKVQNLQKALLRVVIDEEKFHVEQLPDDILGKAEHGKAAIDEVVFNDYETLVHTLEHEKIHLEGVEDDAIVELIVSQRQKLTPMYEEKVEKLMPIVRTLGPEKVIKLFTEKKYTELFKQYRTVSVQQGTSEEDVEKIFFTAFPYWKLKKMRA